MEQRNARSRFEAKESLTFIAMGVGFASFVAMWFVVGDVIGNGNGLMRLIGMAGGAAAGLFIVGQILAISDRASELPTVTCINCRHRESVPGYKVCQPCSDEMMRATNP